MTDRELLELAAKAAGLDGYKYCVPWRAMAQINSLGEFFGGSWNPLTEDGDALRLMVKLAVDIKVRNGATWWDQELSIGCSRFFYEPHGNDANAATRRAIVRAAAEIGQGIKQVVSHDLPDEDNYSGGVLEL